MVRKDKANLISCLYNRQCGGDIDRNEKFMAGTHFKGKRLCNVFNIYVLDDNSASKWKCPAHSWIHRVEHKNEIFMIYTCETTM